MSKPDCIVTVRSSHGPAVTRGDVVRAVADALEQALPRTSPKLSIPDDFETGNDADGPYITFPWFGSPSWVAGVLTDDFLVATVTGVETTPDPRWTSESIGVHVD